MAIGTYTCSCVASCEHDLRMDSETSGPQGVPYLLVSTLLLPTVYTLGKFLVGVDGYLPQQIMAYMPIAYLPGQITGLGATDDRLTYTVGGDTGSLYQN